MFHISLAGLCDQPLILITAPSVSCMTLRINRLPHIPSSISITLPCCDRTAVIIHSQVTLTTTQSINSQYTRSSRKSAERLFLPRKWSHHSFKLHCFVWVTVHMNVLDRCIAQTLQRVDVIIFFHSTSARVRMITQGRCTDV